MKTPYLTSLLIFSVLIPCALFGTDEAAQTNERIKPPSITYHPDAIMPLNTRDKRFSDPRAKVKLKISEEGKVLESLCIYADDYRMAKAAEEVSKEYEFSPAKQNGTPIAVSNVVTIHFKYEHSQESTVDGYSNMVRLTSALPKEKGKLKVTSPRSLDTPPQIVSKAEPVVITDDNNVPQIGKAIVEGYIDSQGKFRFLSIVESDNAFVAEAALLNFSSLTFNQPTVDGRETITKLRIPFTAR